MNREYIVQWMDGGDVRTQSVNATDLPMALTVFRNIWHPEVHPNQIRTVVTA